MHECLCIKARLHSLLKTQLTKKRQGTSSQLAEEFSELSLCNNGTAFSRAINAAKYASGFSPCFVLAIRLDASWPFSASCSVVPKKSQ